MTEFSEAHWTSSDGLRLYYRDYPGRADRPPLLCLHGLTRNSRDFAGLAERLSGQWRLICPDMRGRGESEYAKASETYAIPQYVEDVNLLLAELGIERFVVIGTSMGGLMAMVMALQSPEKIAGVVFNDVGTTLDFAGLERIKSYLGQGRNFPTWMHAARGLQETQGVAHPQFDLSDWVALAKRTMKLSSNGRIVLDYDMKIAEPFMGIDFSDQPDMTPALNALSAKPVLILRGVLSDLLSAQTCGAMLAHLPHGEVADVPNVGHAPLLTEAEAVAGIDRFLAKIA